MSINHVQITPAEEKYAPPGQIIELAVVGDTTDQLVHEETEDAEGNKIRAHYTLKYANQLVLLSLCDYEETNEGSTTKRTVEFPAIALTDLIRALAVFGVQVHAWHLGDVPTQLPAPPEQPK